MNREKLQTCSDELFQERKAHDQVLKEKDALIASLRAETTASDVAHEKHSKENAEFRKGNSALAQRVESAEELARMNVQVIGVLKEQMRVVIARQIAGSSALDQA